MSTILTLHHTQDEHGHLIVTDDGNCRVLAFAPNDEQSRCLKAQPHVLQYEYTQSMFLVLLFCQPKRVLLLGLGGGSVMTTLHHCVPGIHVTAVELRQAVIDVAYRYFYLPRGKRLQVICQNADDYLLQAPERKLDVVFADLYHADGLDALQLRTDFIARCAAQLKAEGWLVLNCWQEHRYDPFLRAALYEHFTDIRTVMTGSRNWVILAGKVQDWQTNSQLRETASRWENALGFALHRSLARLRSLETT
ncbi:MAG: hypothetical protein RI964_1677 [Pseudomonadota bacterium]|jgi:spermidine synthase